jgi:hypothetical protein
MAIGEPLEPDAATRNAERPKGEKRKLASQMLRNKLVRFCGGRMEKGCESGTSPAAILLSTSDQKRLFEKRVFKQQRRANVELGSECLLEKDAVLEHESTPTLSARFSKVKRRNRRSRLRNRGAKPAAIWAQVDKRE